MARFIRLPMPFNGAYVLNSSEVKTVIFEEGENSPTVLICLRGKTEERIEVDFQTDAEAIDFIEKNFILFNK